MTATLLAIIMTAMVPVLLAALGGVLCEQAGITNVALEGQMLIGCFAGVAIGYASGSWLVAAVAAAAFGMLTSLVLALAIVTRGADAIVVGIAINLLAAGLTAVLLKQIFDVSGILQDPRIPKIPQLFEGLHDMPLVGPTLASLTIVSLLAIALVPSLSVLLFRSAWGLRIRGVGENPVAARALGVPAGRIRYLAIAGSGALAGLAGAQLALGDVTQFAEQMTAGRGWIAVVVVMLSGGRPGRAFLACLLFAVADAIGFRLQGQNLPSQATDALPYVVTLLVLSVGHGRARRASASSTAFQKSQIQTQGA